MLLALHLLHFLGTGVSALMQCTFKQILTRFALKLNVFTLHLQAKTIYESYTTSVGRATLPAA